MGQVPGWGGCLTWPHQNPLPTVLTSWEPQALSQAPLHLAGTAEPTEGLGRHETTCRAPSAGFCLPRALSLSCSVARACQSFRCLYSCLSPAPHALAISHCSLVLPYRNVPRLLVLHLDVTSSRNNPWVFFFSCRMVSPSSFTTKEGFRGQKGERGC